MRTRSGLTVLLCFGPWLASSASGQELIGDDPCAHVVTQAEMNACWGQQVTRAEDDLRRVYARLLAHMPDDSADKLRRAQKAWLAFSEAHVQAVYWSPRPYETYGSIYPTCFSVLQVQLILARKAQLEKLMRSAEEDLCRPRFEEVGSSDGTPAGTPAHRLPDRPACGELVEPVSTPALRGARRR